jgi:solute:Na+ symporter, SSS family
MFLPMASIMGDVRIGTLDLYVLIGYFVIIVGVGLWAGMKRKAHADSKGYFLAGGSLTWPVIGMALFSTNISTIHMVGFAEEGYVNGLVYGNFEWMATFLLIVLALFFAPFYLRSRVATLPDFLEKRYSPRCRNWLAGLSIISAVFIHIGFTLYAGAKVVNVLFGIEIMTSIVAAAVLTGIYTIVGGLLAVVVTGALQTVILLTGSIIITLIAMNQIGGWEGLMQYVEPAKMTVVRSASDSAGLPFWAVLIGYPVLGIWYWCADQTIVQRVLGAKDENHARVGPLFAGFLKILPVFIFFLPGLVYLAMVNKGVYPELQNTNDCFSFAIQNFLPAGLTGLIAAALLAALMSTVSGALNSIATLFSFDLYKQWKPETSDKKLIVIGQIATLICMIIAIFWSRMIANFASIFQGISAMISYLAPPVTAVFLCGVFWKRASSKAAFATLSLGGLLGVIVFLLDWFKVPWWQLNFMVTAFLLLLVCFAIMIVISLIHPHQHSAASIKLVWQNPMDALKDKGWRGLGNYKFLSLLLLVGMIGFYWAFSKPDFKAPDTVAQTAPGLECSYYQSDASELYDILRRPAELAPDFSAVSERLELPAELKPEQVAEFTGYFEAPREGFYEFKVLGSHKADMRFADIRTIFKQSGISADGRAILIAQIHLQPGLHRFHFIVYGNSPLLETAEGLPVSDIDITYSFPEEDQSADIEPGAELFSH